MTSENTTQEHTPDKASLSSLSLHSEAFQAIELEDQATLSNSHNEEDQTQIERALSRKSTKLEDKLAQVHDNILPMKQLIVCFLSLSCSLFVSFCDQSSAAIALPLIAKDLNAADSINWAGTASLLANTVCQVLYGRLSDIYGRKNILLVSIVILLVANLLCGFAKSGPEFYVFRALAGIGAGGIQSLTMVIASDSVTLRERGKYQGILGTSVGMGNIVGPLVMGALTEKSTWRDFYRIFPGIIALTFVIVCIFVKGNQSKQLNSVLTPRQKLMKIDYGGMFLSCAGLVLLLVPLSGGGSTFRWDSTLVIVMFVVGGLCIVAFAIYELKVPELPMIPLTAMKSATLSILLVSNFLFGAGYFGFFYVIPYYFQIVRGYSPMRSAVLLIPMLTVQSFMSTVAGTLMSITGHYIYIIAFGYSIWLTGLCVTLKWGTDSSIGLITGTLIMIGTGAGFIFQPSIVAIQANCKKSQRAVIIGFRNVLRSFGGAFGIAVSSLVISNTLNNSINKEMSTGFLPQSFLLNMKSHVFSHPDYSGFSPQQILHVKQMYMDSIKDSSYFLIPLLALSLLTCVVIRDNGLHCIDEPKEEKKEGQV